MTSMSASAEKPDLAACKCAKGPALRVAFAVLLRTGMKSLAAVVAAFLVVVSVSTHAHADDAEAPPDHKSEATATEIALLTTVAGYGLMIGGARAEQGGLSGTGAVLALIGPSAGHIYAGEGKHAVGGTLLRTGGLMIMAMGLIPLTSAADEGAPNPNGTSHDNDHSGGRTMVAVGAAIFIGSTIYDIVDASRAAERTNKKNAAKYQVMPAPIMTANGVAPGLTFSGQF